MPSVESRARGQSWQKACVTEEITPISPAPSAAVPRRRPSAAAAALADAKPAKITAFDTLASERERRFSTGIAEAVGAWAGTVGSLFILAAFITSYWSVSLALADILREEKELFDAGASEAEVTLVVDAEEVPAVDHHALKVPA